MIGAQALGWEGGRQGFNRQADPLTLHPNRPLFLGVKEVTVCQQWQGALPSAVAAGRLSQGAQPLP